MGLYGVHKFSVSVGVCIYGYFWDSGWLSVSMDVYGCLREPMVVYDCLYLCVFMSWVSIGVHRSHEWRWVAARCRLYVRKFFKNFGLFPHKVSVPSDVRANTARR